MTKTEALEILIGKNEASQALEAAMSLIHWDAATTGVPPASLQARGKIVGWLSGEHFRRLMAEDTLKAIETLEDQLDTLSVNEKAMVREMGRAYRKSRAVPPDQMQEFAALCAEAEPVWETARKNRDFNMIAPYYEKIFEFQRKLCDWYGYKDHPYDALLDDYEKGANVKMLDEFFKAVRDGIVPLLKVVKEGKKPRAVTGTFSKDKQRDLAPWLCSFVGYDMTRGKIGEVAHPFCMTVNLGDVRISTNYHEDQLFSALYSIIHESGHALYEQNMSEELTPYGLASCASMGIHESQSRFYENMIGRSREFAERLLPQLQERFELFKDFSADDLYLTINTAKPSLIRIEADELTYCLHILVRYELEKGIIEGNYKVRDLPELWSSKYEEVLGVRPEHAGEGVLQDVHWGGGMVGYFPSYAVGNAYAAQLMAAMRKTVDVESAVSSGDLTPVNTWMRENVHRHGALLLPDELILKATGKHFDPSDYIAYLSGKYTELYK